MSSTSLRKQSRARRHAAISAAALRLFADQGYDDTTVVEIAAAAEVSPRTVSLYFPTKLDLALSYTTDAAARMAEVFEARGRDDLVVDLLDRWLQLEIREHSAMLGMHRAMLGANPALRGAQTREVTETKRVICLALADEVARPPDDPVVALINGAIDGTIAALLQLAPEDTQATGASLIARRLIRTIIEAASSDTLDH